MKVKIIILIVLLTTGSANSEPFPKTGLSEVTFNVMAENLQGQKIPLELMPDQPIAFYFPVISGGVFGNPMEDNSIEFFRVNDKQQIQFDLSSMRKKFTKNAKKLKRGFTELGLQMKPKRTKLARMGSFAIHVEDPQYVKGTFFKKTDNDDMILLVYFDRKTSLTGEIKLGGEIYRHDVAIPQKGFYWLESIEVEEGVFDISRTHNFNEVDLIFRVDVETNETKKIVKEKNWHLTNRDRNFDSMN